MILFLSFGSPDDWECFLHYLGCLLDDDSNWCDRATTDPIHPPKFVECKISNLTDEVVQITLAFILYLFFSLPMKIKVVHIHALIALALCVSLLSFPYLDQKFPKKLTFCFLLFQLKCSLILVCLVHLTLYKSCKEILAIILQGVHTWHILKLKGGSAYMARAMMSS